MIPKSEVREIEIVRADSPRGRFRAGVFDFDGTLSLLREGWPAVMTELMSRELHRTAGRPTRFRRSSRRSWSA